MTFKDNTANSGVAIFSYGHIDLTDTHFTGNWASYEGGAIYVRNGSRFVSDGGNGTVNYTVTAGKTITLNPDAKGFNGALRTSNNNDIACANINDTGDENILIFTKKGPGTLVLNTNNQNWRGRTVIDAGAFIIGETS